MGKVSIERSVRYHLEQMTEDEVKRYCTIVGVDAMPPEEFRDWFKDFSEEGLAQLLFVRFEQELPE
jgi:hypothetical protein